MSTRPRDLAGYSHSDRGWILVEVCIAVLLLGCVLVPLAGSLIRGLDLSGSVRSRSASIAGEIRGMVGGERGWGTQIVRAEWSPGPALDLQTGREADNPREVGVWVDGWLLTRLQADAQGEALLGMGFWSGLQGGSVVVRVRTENGCWGPPWRTAVPGADGRPFPVGSQPGLDEGDGEVVVHAPVAANPAIHASWPEGPLEAGEAGLPFFARMAPVGAVGLELDGQEQTLRMETGGEVDVYF